MKYILLLYNPAQAPRYTPEEAKANRQGWFDVLAEMKTAGVFLAYDGLAPVADAKTVRVRNGQTMTSDGPFAKTDDDLGAYFMLDCKDIGEAISWAAKLPYAQNGGSVEVRPVVSYS